MNMWDFALGIVIIALIAFAIWPLARSRAKGACAACPHAKACHESHNELQDCPGTR